MSQQNIMSDIKVVVSVNYYIYWKINVSINYCIHWKVDISIKYYV